MSLYPGIFDIMSNFDFVITDETFDIIERIMYTILEITVSKSYVLSWYSDDTKQLNVKALVNAIRILFSENDSFMAVVLKEGERGLRRSSVFKDMRQVCVPIAKSKVSKSYASFMSAVLEYTCTELIRIMYVEMLIRTNNSSELYMQLVDIETAIKNDPVFGKFFQKHAIKLLKPSILSPKRKFNKVIRDYIKTSSNDRLTVLKVSNKSINLLQRYIESCIKESS